MSFIVNTQTTDPRTHGTYYKHTTNKTVALHGLQNLINFLSDGDAKQSNGPVNSPRSAVGSRFASVRPNHGQSRLEWQSNNPYLRGPTFQPLWT